MFSNGASASGNTGFAIVRACVRALGDLHCLRQPLMRAPMQFDREPVPRIAGAESHQQRIGECGTDAANGSPGARRNAMWSMGRRVGGHGCNCMASV